MSIVTSLVLFSLSPRSTLGPTQPSCLCQLRLASTLMNLGTALGGPAASSGNSRATLAMAARHSSHHALPLARPARESRTWLVGGTLTQTSGGRPHRVDGLRPLRPQTGYLARSTCQATDAVFADKGRPRFARRADPDIPDRIVTTSPGGMETPALRKVCLAGERRVRSRLGADMEDQLERLRVSSLQSAGLEVWSWKLFRDHTKKARCDIPLDRTRSEE
jgi:hypothetical protein